MIEQVPAGVGEVIDGTQVGVVGFLVWQLARLATRVTAFLDGTREHQKKTRMLLRELVLVLRRGAPAEEIHDPTPAPRDVESFRRARASKGK
jgi:hypothetical protein